MQRKEISDRKSAFLTILKLLVDFDRQTGNDKQYEALEGHYMRSAIAVANPQNTRIFLRESSNFAYTVVAEHWSTAGIVVSTHIHEDGIAVERQTAPANHPVHSIVCVTDLYQSASPLERIDGLNPVTRRLLLEDGGHPKE